MPELGGGVWLTSRHGHFTSGKEPRYPLSSKLGGPQSRSELFLENRKISCDCRESNHDHPIRSLVTILTPLSRLHKLKTFSSNNATAPSGSAPPHYQGLTITLRHSTLGRTPLDEWSARRRDLYLKTHNTHNRQTSMPPAGLEPTIPASERPQIHALDRTATGIG
jgi:hypothetical protein